MAVGSADPGKMPSSPLAHSLHRRVEIVLDRLRPALLRDGGNIELLDVSEDGTVRVELQGACVTCPAQTATLQHAVAPLLRAEVPEVVAVIPIREDDPDARAG